MTALGSAPKRHRATSLSPPEKHLLDGWALATTMAFGGCPYLVGSVARAERQWRDVDVRMILDDEDFDALRAGSDERIKAMNTAFSLWGQKATGLPIDFQFQSMTEANVPEHDGPRHPIGMRIFNG